MIKSKDEVLEVLPGHNNSVLEVLEALRVCANGGFVPDFHYRPRAGICWHVFSQTSDSSITINELTPVFESMGLDPEYPVEMQQVQYTSSAALLYRDTPNHYDGDTITGKARLTLLDDLIQYYQNLI